MFTKYENSKYLIKNKFILIKNIYIIINFKMIFKT